MEQPGLTPVTADGAMFMFYDIEALSNFFSLCVYAPRPDGTALLEAFYLVDEDATGSCLADSIDHSALGRTIFERNPGLPPHPATRLRFFDLRQEACNLRLARIVGLSDAALVCDPRGRSSFPAELRPVCDTDPGYDPVRHAFLAGYNSMNYDTVMLALYLYEVFGEWVDHDDRVAEARSAVRRHELYGEWGNPGSDLADWQERLRVEQADRPAFRLARAARLRAMSDELFSDAHIEYMPGYLGWDGPAARIRRAMLQSGRHVDVARLNELQFKVGLKRLLGMLGRQIKESDKLRHDSTITTLDDLYELLAYNVSDCLGLSQLFRHPTYSSAFDLKSGLLRQFTETVRDRNGAVRRDRLAVDSSSAKFVGRILAPYEPLSDIRCVSFEYPHPAVAAEQGTTPVNVLEECRKFFLGSVVPDLVVDDLSPTAESAAAYPLQADALARFAEVVRYYRSIEGENFNDSAEYREKHPDGPTARVLKAVPKTPNNVPYFHAGGRPSSCFATFSTGGIHGAEAAMDVFVQDRIEHVGQDTMISRASIAFPDAKDFVAEAKRQHSRLPLPDGSCVDKRLVLLGSDPEKVRYRKPKKDDPLQQEQLERARSQVPDPAELLSGQRPESEALVVALADGTEVDGKLVLANATAAKAAYRDGPAKKAPQLFVPKDDGSTRLHPRFARTSAGLVVHEDFTSYYPNLLRNMRAFWNPDLGEDRYARIFFDKERYGREMKRPGVSPEERARLNTLRDGTKLVLNAASGAGDAGHRTPIRMNNVIVSMRIIGQLFSWRIGQAQTLAGARIVSTNTDGLYSVIDHGSGFGEAENNRVLAEQQEAIGVDIEPETMFLVSKDSNNRLDLAAPSKGRSVAESRVLSASGGTLACHGGPTPTKSLAHPAVLDFALARYLQTIAARGEAALAEPFDPLLGRKMVLEALNHAEPVASLMLFQNVIAASRGSITYPFAADPIDGGAEVEDSGEGLRNPRPLQVVNRVFIVEPGTPGAVSLRNAGAWKVTPASRDKRRESGESGVRRDKVALDILRHHGWARDRNEAGANPGLSILPDDQDVVVRRINGIDPKWSVLVVNDDLHVLLAADAGRIIRSLDIETYTSMLGETFTKNWMNAA